MADLRIQMGEGRGDVLCDNCGSTQSNRIQVFFNETQNRIEVDKTCVCYVGSTRYVQNYTISTPES